LYHRKITAAYPEWSQLVDRTDQILYYARALIKLGIVAGLPLLLIVTINKTVRHRVTI
jgi:hypothetical protein